MKSGRWAIAAGLLMALGAVSTPARASTVEPMSLSTMADHAGQAIVGEVAEVNSYRADRPRRIESLVVFKNVQYLKGRQRDSTDTFKLVVPGGAIGDEQMRLCCAPAFAVGQKWVLLLLPEYRTFPVVGLYQGAFRIVADAQGDERVYYEVHGAALPITGFDAEGFVRIRCGRGPDAKKLLMVANHLRLNDRAAASDDRSSSPGRTDGPEAMTYQAFLSRLQPVLDASKACRLSTPAGRSLGFDCKAMPLETAASCRAKDHRHGASAVASQSPEQTGESSRQTARSLPAAPQAEAHHVRVRSDGSDGAAESPAASADAPPVKKEARR